MAKIYAVLAVLHIIGIHMAYYWASVLQPIASEQEYNTSLTLWGVVSLILTFPLGAMLCLLTIIVLFIEE